MLIITIVPLISYIILITVLMLVNIISIYQLQALLASIIYCKLHVRPKS
jgi:hypothetical protein